MKLSSRRAFTLIELLVVVGIISVLIGLLIPAVQKVREAALRLKCANNLRQIGIGLLNRESLVGDLPPASVGNKINWRHQLLPFIEQEKIFKRIKADKPWHEGENLSVVAVTPIGTFECPSVPIRPDVRNLVLEKGSRPIAFDRPLTTSDYEVVLGIEPDQYRLVMNPENKDPLDLFKRTRGAMIANTPTKLDDFLDGISQTILISESAGRPDMYGLSRSVIRYREAGGIPEPTRASCWADTTGPYVLDLGIPTSPVAETPQPTGPVFGKGIGETTNKAQPYSFHTGGFQAVTADGSLRFFRVMDWNKAIRLLTIRGHEPGLEEF